MQEAAMQEAWVKVLEKKLEAEKKKLEAEKKNEELKKKNEELKKKNEELELELAASRRREEKLGKLGGEAR